MRLMAALVLTCGLSVLFDQTSSHDPSCQIENKNYFGWNAIAVSNRWVTLTIVPQLGGRLMQVTFGGHDYLWVNEQLKGQYFSPDESLAQKRWFSYGGDKIWPMPEGSNDEQHWPGAVGSRLDAGAFAAEVLSRKTTCSIRLLGPRDPVVGQQYVRDISIGTDSPMISFHAVMKNVSGYPQTWSEQSVSQYTTEDAGNPGRPNPDFWGLTPVNAQSAFPNSYHVRTGGDSSAGYSVRDGLFAVHTIDAAGEVWVDSSAEWLAVVDGATKYTMVERFRYQRGAEYPGNATVIFYTTRRPDPETTHTSREPIFYMEAEINSPMVRLDPGETYAMDTQWSPTRMGTELKTATYAGVIGQPLSAVSASGTLTLAGSFGVFFAGQLEVRFYDKEGTRIGAKTVQDVLPTDVVTLQQTIQAPADTTRVSLHVIDRHGSDRGPLGEAAVTHQSAR